MAKKVKKRTPKDRTFPTFRALSQLQRIRALEKRVTALDGAVAYIFRKLAQELR